MELVALYWMHGVENAFHGFLRLNDESAAAWDGPGPHTTNYPAGRYEAAMTATDDEIFAMSENVPPVKV